MDTRQRIETARARLLDLKSDEAKLVGPSCGECRHRGFKALNRQFVLVCDHIVYAERRFDPAAGRLLETNETSREEARGPDGLCGPEAILFEPASAFSVAAHRFMRSIPGRAVAAAAAGGFLLKLLG